MEKTDWLDRATFLKLRSATLVKTRTADKSGRTTSMRYPLILPLSPPLIHSLYRQQWYRKHRHPLKSLPPLRPNSIWWQELEAFENNLNWITTKMFISSIHMGPHKFFISLPFLVGPGSSQVHGPHIGQKVWPPYRYGSQPLQVRLSLSKPPSILIFINSVLPTFACADTRAQEKHGGIYSTFDKFPTTLQGQLEHLAAISLSTASTTGQNGFTDAFGNDSSSGSGPRSMKTSSTHHFWNIATSPRWWSSPSERLNIDYIVYMHFAEGVKASRAWVYKERLVGSMRCC